MADMRTIDKVFYYHADASAVGGFLTHPERQLIRADGSCSLSQAGGETSGTLHNFRHGNVLSIRHARTYATGAPHRAVPQRPEDTQNALYASGGWTTLVTAVVEGFNLLDVLTADRITARISLEYPAGGNTPRVSVLGSGFENLRLEGEPLHLPLVPHLLQDSDVRPAGRDWPSNEALVHSAIESARLVHCDTSMPDAIRHRFAGVSCKQEIAEKGYLRCSVVQPITQNRESTPGRRTAGHVVSLPGFGTLYFGELIVTRDAFRLAMVRAELGCAVDGDLCAACVSGNGRPMP